jgi:LemA protein
MRAWAFALLLVSATGLSGCGYNRLQQLDEGVKASWSEVVNQYQRRADLIPNLVATVKGFAIQEQQVLIGVTEARAKASSIQLTPELINDPAAFAKFQQAQGELTQALKSLFAVTEAYPNIKSDANFRDLGSRWRVTAISTRYASTTPRYASSQRISLPNCSGTGLSPISPWRTNLPSPPHPRWTSAAARRRKRSRVPEAPGRPRRRSVHNQRTEMRAHTPY